MATENDEDMEYLLEEYIQTKGQIEGGKKELTLNEVKYISMFNHVREILFQSLGSEDLITGAISNFDETGNYLGLPREIQEILENRRIDVDAILIRLEDCVVKLLTEDHDLSVVAERRWNFHILAIIMQLLQLLGLTENDVRMIALQNRVFSHLANQNHDWVDLTNVEIEVLQDACNLCEEIPRKILGKLLYYALRKN